MSCVRRWQGICRDEDGVKVRGADLETGVRVGQLLGANGAALRGALKVVFAVQPHLCWKHAAHHHKSHLPAHAHPSTEPTGHTWIMVD